VSLPDFSRVPFTTDIKGKVVIDSLDGTGANSELLIWGERLDQDVGRWMLLRRELRDLSDARGYCVSGK
jgi:hypothetical protein